MENKEFQYKEIDQEGHLTLDVVGGADRFNEWMYTTIKPYCKGKILEIGSGIGNISKYFITDNADLTLSDIRESYCSILKDQFNGKVNPEKILRMDILDPVKKEDECSYDAIFALNVFEHIEDHELAIRNCYKLLKEKGKLIILVPAYMSLYNDFDKNLYHFRRYDRGSLTKLFAKADLRVLKSFYFNFAGIAGWFISGTLQKNATIPNSQISLYNKLVPIFKLIDFLTFRKAGLSIVVVGEK